MAAKNDEGELTEVPGLILESETHVRRFYEGRRLKMISAEKRKMLKAPLDDLKSAIQELELGKERMKINF
jgi:hypothetical protein